MVPRAADPERAAATEAAILEAARDLLADGGLSGLSMRAVAGRVGLSAAAIYNYFENKQALVDRVVTSGFRRFTAHLRSAMEGLPRGSADRLYALGEAYIRFALENQAYFKVIFTIQPEDPRTIEELPDGGGYEVLRRAVEEAMESGEIRRDDPDLVALYLWSHVHGLVSVFLACQIDEGWEWRQKKLSATDLFARFRTFVREGLRPGGAGAPETGSRVSAYVDE